MKKTAMWLAVFLVCGAAMAQDYGSEVRFGLDYAFPGAGDFDLYDSGLGFGVQYRNWIGDPLGYGVSIGWAEWDTDSGGTDIGGDVLGDFDGSVTLIPLGVSGLYKLADFADWKVTLEAGLKYVLADSGISAVHFVGGREDDLDISDGVVGVIGADYERNVGTEWSWFVGAVYQFDLQKGEIEVDHGNLRDNELQAFLLRAGAAFSF